MKRLTGCLLFAFFIMTVSGQQLYLEAGKVLSSFNYKNSDGNSPADLKGSMNNSFGFGARLSVLKSAWHISLGVTTNRYGATSSDPVLGNYSEWLVSYLGVNLGVDYEFFKPEMVNTERDGFSFYLKGAFATEFLISGKQKLNNQIFDLIGIEEFDRPVFILKGGTGLKYYITRSYVIYAQYMFGRSVLFGNYENQEQLRYMTHTISLGFSIDLFYKRK